MKPRIFYILLTSLLFISCSNKENNDSTKLAKTDRNCTNQVINNEGDFEPYIYSITDSTSDVFVTVTNRDRKGSHSITWGNTYFRDSADLDLITEGQGYRMPPSYSFANKNFICLMTNWSGPFSQHLFLPLNHKLKIEFFKEDIQWMDTVKSEICYIHPEMTDSLKTSWTYEKLTNGYKKAFEVPIFENSLAYPWYTKIEKQGNTLIIEPQGEVKQKVKIEID